MDAFIDWKVSRKSSFKLEFPSMSFVVVLLIIGMLQRPLPLMITSSVDEFPGLLSIVQILTQQQIVMMTRQMPHQLLQRIKVQRTEATLVPSARLRRIYDVPMHRAQMLQQMRLLLEHRHTQSTSEWLFARVYAQMRLQVPRHSKLLATVLTAILTNRIARIRVARRARVLVVVARMMVGMLVLLLLLKGRLRKT